MIKYHLRNAIEWLLRRLPVSRAAYAQLSTLQKKVDALAESQTVPVPSFGGDDRSRKAEGSDGVIADRQNRPSNFDRSTLSLPAALLGGSNSMSLRGGLFSLTTDGPLGKAGDALLLPFDEAMLPSIVANNGWSLETLKFLADTIDPDCSYVALDIGANIGLFTRQIALRFPNVKQIFCVEAEPGNFRCLQYNIDAVLDGRARLWNLALSDSDGMMEFYRDRGNFGNYSLNHDAMRAQPFDSVLVKTVGTGRWMRDNIQIAPGDKVIWKSDTQGYDELIISLAPIELWNRVNIAIIELWRIRKPDFDQEAFRLRIDAFPNKFLGIGNDCTTNDILEYLRGDDYAYTDLYLWR